VPGATAVEGEAWGRRLRPGHGDDGLGARRCRAWRYASAAVARSRSDGGAAAVSGRRCRGGGRARARERGAGVKVGRGRGGRGGRGEGRVELGEAASTTRSGCVYGGERRRHW
jgi:hypothetical protein